MSQVVSRVGRLFGLLLVVVGVALGIYSAAGGRLPIDSPFSDVVARFEGGEFGKTQTTETPLFEVKPDWTATVEIRGDFNSIAIVPENPTLENYVGQGYSMIDTHGKTESYSLRNSHGGRHSIRMSGNGVWKVVVHQGSGGH